MGLSVDLVPVISTFTKNLTGGYPFLTQFTTPGMGACCNFRNQFVAANIVNDPTSIWSDLYSDGILWSGIGNFELNPIVDYTAGFKTGGNSHSFGARPTIYKVLPLEGHHFQGVPMIVVYSNAGKFLLVPNETRTGFVYGESVLRGLGITSGNHVAGDEYIHGFIDSYRDFWTLESPHYSSPAGGNLKKLGYRKYILNLFNYVSSEDHRVIVSYIPKEARFYISNGNECLIINQFGACNVFQCPSSVIAAPDGNLYGTFKSLPDLSARIVTDELDFGTRALKSIESMFGAIDSGPDATVKFTVDWNKASGDDFFRLPFRNVNPRGEAHIGATGAEFRAVVSISDYTEAQIQWLMFNVKFPDNRFRRGATMGPESVVTRQGQP
jgi:hypothetical protein